MKFFRNIPIANDYKYPFRMSKKVILSLVSTVVTAVFLSSCSTSSAEDWQKSSPFVFKPGEKQIACELKDFLTWTGEMYFNVKNVSGKNVEVVGSDENPDFRITNFNLSFRLYDADNKELAHSNLVEGFFDVKYPFLAVTFNNYRINSPVSYAAFLDGKEFYRDKISHLAGGSIGLPQKLVNGYCNDDLDANYKAENAADDAKWETFLKK